MAGSGVAEQIFGGSVGVGSMLSLVLNTSTPLTHTHTQSQGGEREREDRPFSRVPSIALKRYLYSVLQLSL